MTKEEFKAARLELGLTQTEMGQALGVSLNIVQKWESGDRPIRQVVAMAMELLLERHRRKNEDAAA